ncbi:MAG TPA: LuxR family transcriptional regulator [Hungateiclostridium thermocellum]|jgi:hypothetical protein|uniref:Dockerin type 1 n=3 Tax=Acetivibrio thermocellus TaxID=1515 RepID=A3DCJ7_ACET2|nr:Dockerin type 1 [Acetivibrio thermocellus ATCC 27405]ADU74839.1 Dockerin type 1 [Acetivibrio thermocellus DSM 1313]ALX08793.1 Dockerin type 1 protein [Acetivibrio thermocellus AD2]ANV76544.1 Dockerin type 1 protein [Acetivibrio thermocellus DSM 2360]EIC05201.1 Dockerin type 1 protein [Acetivibrio thermocellus YS]SOD24579.1 Dockerin type I repeat-containing protein [Acetivibrio thermocellus]
MLKFQRNFGKYYLFKGYVQMRKIKIINYFPLFFMLFIVILRVFFVSSSAEVANTADTNIKLLQNSEAPFKYGDLNGDNNINSSDYTLLKRYLLHTIRESPEKRPHPHFGEKYSGVDNLSNLIDLSYLK